jgi:hypothetical protein
MSVRAGGYVTHGLRSSPFSRRRFEQNSSRPGRGSSARSNLESFALLFGKANAQFGGSPLVVRHGRPASLWFVFHKFIVATKKLILKVR